MDQQASIHTYQTLVSAIRELLTVAVHTILAEREVYPRTSFLKVRKWGLAVYQSRHPGVIRWIEDAIDAVEKEILKGAVRQTSLVVLSSSGVPLERFVFLTENFPALPTVSVGHFTEPDDEDSSDPASEDAEGDRIPGVPVMDLAAQFRGMLSRFCSVSAKLPTLPSNCSFTLAIELKDKPAGDPPLGWPQPFIPSDPKVGQPDSKASRITPVRNVDIGIFDMETWVEETTEKAKLILQMASQNVSQKRSPSPEERAFDPLLEAMEGKTFMS